MYVFFWKSGGKNIFLIVTGEKKTQFIPDILCKDPNYDYLRMEEQNCEKVHKVDFTMI